MRLELHHLVASLGLACVLTSTPVAADTFPYSHNIENYGLGTPLTPSDEVELVGGAVDPIVGAIRWTFEFLVTADVGRITSSANWAATTDSADATRLEDVHIGLYKVDFQGGPPQPETLLFSFQDDGVTDGRGHASLDQPLPTFQDGFYRLAVTGTAFGNPDFSLTMNLPPVPEPATWALVLAGLAGVAGVARRRKSA
ncbi:FxDxF family PEP-CTERM protein [Caldimonas brevitalea]|uniref:Ice-binding protein C-terminal domain-containing protein n=1 Tax=Caldimonas brevitalea TaxID=413882 RepID=A0A0G3BLC2_9BURK|nr:FxDxF family PEP-CTERM protein [Caldimonas brevitalea]AKJ30217.1 hypothetical protein AAW51_3526 [Caldimonas brevitalea]